MHASTAGRRKNTMPRAPPTGGQWRHNNETFTHTHTHTAMSVVDRYLSMQAETQTSHNAFK